MARSRNNSVNPEKSNKVPRFLEPLYLNESMVLNSAAYLFGGMHTSVESTETSQTDISGGLGVKTPTFGAFLDAKVGIGHSHKWEESIKRKLTLGAIHMNVIDELGKRGMINEINLDGFQGSFPLHENYLECRGVLFPNDYHSLLHTIEVAWPLVMDLIKVLMQVNEMTSPTNPDVVDEEAEGHKNVIPVLDLLKHIDEYGGSVQGLVERLRRDYFTSKHMEMILKSKNGKGRAVAVVDLDVSEYEPAVLRSQLSGGKYHVIGKVVRVVDSGSSISMFDKSILGAVYDLVKRVLASRRDSAALARFDDSLRFLNKVLTPLMTLEIHGPALRISAMSVSL